MKTNLKFEIDKSWMIPIESGQAVSTGWSYSDGKPTSVTWHWTATWNRKACDKTLGGANALQKGVASAHYCVGRSFREGISQYVDLENRSWHAGAGQTVRWDGKQASHGGKFLSGSRVSIGIETVEIGYARKGVDKKDDWIEVYDSSGKRKMWVEPWTEEQIEMMIFVGKEILKKYPHIKPEDHHGHMDICPDRKDDPSLAFPFAKVLSGIYDKKVIDIWSPFLLIEPRQKALQLLGYDLGKWGADGDWGQISDKALKQFQKDHDLFDNGQWSTFVCWKIYNALKAKNISISDV